jgi:hypothetical protein
MILLILKGIATKVLRSVWSWILSDILSLLEYLIIIIPLLLIASLSIHTVYKIALVLPVVVGLGCKFDRWQRHK